MRPEFKIPYTKISESSMREATRKAGQIRAQTVSATEKSKLGRETSFSTAAFSLHSTTGERYGEEQEDFAVYEEFSRNIESPSVIGQALFNAGIEMGLHALEYAGGGSTATFCYIHGNRIFVLQVGDSQAHLISSTKAQRLSEIHQPEFEKERIKKEGGELTKLPGNSTLYLCDLAVSRSFGERHLYTPSKAKICSSGMTFLPSISMVEINPLSENYLFICSDGIGDEIEIEDIQKRLLQRGETSLQHCNQAIHQSATDRGGNDNRTSIIIDLSALKKRGENKDHLFGVCDGHCGYQIAQRIAKVFPQIFRKILGKNPEYFPGLSLDAKTKSPFFFDQSYTPVPIDEPEAIGRSRANLFIPAHLPELKKKREQAFAKIALARFIGENLNSPLIWNGREKAAYIFAAINYLSKFLETPNDILYHEPLDSLWCLRGPESNSKSLIDALIWPRWSKPEDGVSDSLQIFRNGRF